MKKSHESEELSFAQLSQDVAAFRAHAQRLQNALIEGARFDGACEAVRAAVRQWQQKHSAAAAQATLRHTLEGVQKLTAEAQDKLRAAISAAAASGASAASAAASSKSGGTAGSGGAGGVVHSQIDALQRTVAAALQGAESAERECERVQRVLASSSISASAELPHLHMPGAVAASDARAVIEAMTSGASPCASGDASPPELKTTDGKTDRPSGTRGSRVEAKTDSEERAGGSSAMSGAGASGLRSALDRWQRLFAEVQCEVQGLSQRWRDASAARESAVRAVSGLLLPAASAAPAPVATTGAGAGRAGADGKVEEEKKDAIGVKVARDSVKKEEKDKKVEADDEEEEEEEEYEEEEENEEEEVDFFARATTLKRSRSERAGLQFPVGLISRFLCKGRYAARVGGGAPVYLAAALEYLSAELLEVPMRCISWQERGLDDGAPRYLVLPALLGLWLVVW